MKLHVLFLTALPMCLAQFSIQGPSDGHRRAQGLKFSAEKGIEYTDQSESEGPGDFTIQGATDGNSDFRIQGATDGHSNFQIQGPSDGGAATFHIQGATNEGVSSIQGAYDPNQGNAKSLQYNDPSGYRVNWRSYERQARPSAQAEPQYAPQPAPQPAAPIRQAAHRRAPRPQQAPEPQPQYKHYANAPPQIQQLLQFQQQIPYINVIPEPYRFDEQAAIKAQAEQVREHYRNIVAQPPPGSAPPPPPAPAPAPEPRHRPRGPSRHKREANPQQAQQPQYRRVSQLPTEPQPRYSTNLPTQLRELLKFQAQTPYNIFANQVSYRGPDKPYVPQSVSPPQQQPPQQLQQQPVQQAQYQGQGGGYQGQASAYTQARVAGYNQGQQLGYNQQQQQPGVRPVTENQY